MDLNDIEIASANNSPESVKAMIAAKNTLPGGKQASFQAASSEGEKEESSAPEEGESSPESETGATGEEGAKPETPKKSKGDKRFDKMTKENAELSRERDLWKKQALEGKPTDADKKPDPAKDTKESAPRPKSEDFTSNDDFIEALSAWKADQLISKRFAEEAEKNKRAENEKVLKENATKFESRMEETRARYDDFDEVAMDSEMVISPIMIQTIQESEVGPDIAYWLSSHPEETEKMKALSPLRQALELGKLEDKITAALDSEKETGEEAEVPKPKVQAKSKPKPPFSISGKGNGNSNVLSSPRDAKEFEDYKRLRLKQRN